MLAGAGELGFELRHGGVGAVEVAFAPGGEAHGLHVAAALAVLADDAQRHVAPLEIADGEEKFPFLRRIHGAC